MTSNYAALLAQINFKLPNISYNSINSQPKKDVTFGVSLTDRFLNADFNNDGLPDVAVILKIVDFGIGYFTNTVFVVLQDLKNGPYVTNGIDLGLATYKIDTFSFDPANNNIIVSFMDRLPG
jgi:hypothetical protein